MALPGYTGSNPALSPNSRRRFEFTPHEERVGENPLFDQRRGQCERRAGRRGEAHGGPERVSATDGGIAVR